MRSVKCDECGRDLSDAGPSPTTRMHLNSEWMPSSSSFRYALGVITLIPIGGYDFCGLNCLLTWGESRKPEPRKPFVPKPKHEHDGSGCLDCECPASPHMSQSFPCTCTDDPDKALPKGEIG